MTKIKFERSGGYAGVTLAHALETKALPAPELARVQKLIDDANLFELPKQVKSRDAMPDRFEYKITIREKGRQRTLVIGERSTPENLKPLIDYLVEQSKK
jgi:hypothetical protein